MINRLAFFSCCFWLLIFFPETGITRKFYWSQLHYRCTFVHTHRSPTAAILIAMNRSNSGACSSMCDLLIKDRMMRRPAPREKPAIGDKKNLFLLEGTWRWWEKLWKRFSSGLDSLPGRLNTLSAVFNSTRRHWRQAREHWKVLKREKPDSPAR